MGSFNKITIVGYLGKDPEIRYLPDGTGVCNFSIASTEKRKDIAGTPREITTWFRVSVFGRQGEACNEYLAKGSQVYVEGRLTQQEYVDRDGNPRTSLEIRATDCQFLTTKAKGDEAEGHAADHPPARSRAASATAGNGRKVTPEQSRAAMVAQGADEDEIPF